MTGRERADRIREGLEVNRPLLAGDLLPPGSVVLTPDEAEMIRKALAVHISESGLQPVAGNRALALLGEK